MLAFLFYSFLVLGKASLLIGGNLLILLLLADALSFIAMPMDSFAKFLPAEYRTGLLGIVVAATLVLDAWLIRHLWRRKPAT